MSTSIMSSHACGTKCVGFLSSRSIDLGHKIENLYLSYDREKTADSQIRVLCSTIPSMSGDPSLRTTMSTNRKSSHACRASALCFSRRGASISIKSLGIHVFHLSSSKNRPILTSILCPAFLQSGEFAFEIQCPLLRTFRSHAEQGALRFSFRRAPIQVNK